MTNAWTQQNSEDLVAWSNSKQTTKTISTQEANELIAGVMPPPAVHTNGTIPPGTKATWRSSKGLHDERITIKDAGVVVEGIRYYATEEFSGGTPENEIILDPPPAPTVNGNGNGHQAPDDEFDAEALANESMISPPGPITTSSIGAIIPHLAKFDNREAALAALRSLIAPLPEEERGDLKLPLRAILFSDNRDVDDFLASCPKPTTGTAFTPYSYEDLLAMPPKEWHIDQVIGAGDIGMFYGMAGCNKTFTVIDLIHAACKGEQWARRFNVTRPLTVAYCAGEGFSGLPARFIAAGMHHGVTRLPTFTYYKTTPQLFEGGEDITVQSIRRFIDEWRARQSKGQAGALDLLIIDTLHTATVAADENSAKDMGVVLSMCRRAAIELGCAVLLVHHTNKTGSAERGSSALRGSMDFMVEIRKISETGTKAVMTCAKLKDGEAWKEQTFDLVALEGCESVRVWWDEPNDGAQTTGQKATDKDALKAEMERYAGTRFTVKSLAEVIAKSENYTRNLISELEKSKEVKRDLSDPKKGYSPRNPWVYFVPNPEAELAEAGL